MLLAKTCLGYTCTVQLKNQPQKLRCSLNHPLLCSFVPYLRLILHPGPRVALIWCTTSILGCPSWGMLSKDTLTGRKLIVLKRKASRTANNLAVYHKSSSIPSSSFSPQGCSFKLAAVCFFFFLMGVWGRELASSHSELSCDHLFFPPHVVRFPKWLYFFFLPPCFSLP